MDSSHAASSSGGALAKNRKFDSSGGGDRLSMLTDHALGHILSFLPADEAARAAMLSSRWRHVFAAVHTVSLEEPERLIPDDDDGRYDSPSWRPPPNPNAPPPFYSTVSNAIIARQRRRGAVPLRALRVAVESYCGLRGESTTVDQWVSYAVQQAAAEGLHIDLRLQCRHGICDRHYTIRCGKQQHQTPTSSELPCGLDYTVPDEDDSAVPPADFGDDDSAVPPADSDDDDSTVPSSDSDDDERKKASKRRRACVSYLRRPRVVPAEYMATRVIFSCAHLRSLSLGSCWLALPDTISLPSLVTLLLSRVRDPGSDLERLVACCPRLADLTLEACRAVTALSIVAGARLRRLALRCCHNTTAVAVDSSELQAFEYRGAVPGSSFLTMHGGSTRILYCKVDICGEEATSENEIVNLRQFLQLFVNVKHLHLESARLGSCLDKDVPVAMRLGPLFLSLMHLEIRGCLPDDDTAGAIAAVSTVLEQAPNLETLSLAFHYPQERDSGGCADDYIFSSDVAYDAHYLSYNPHSTLTTPSAMIPCLRNKVREINLVHYQGGTAQRALAKFLLSNAPVIDRLWCEFAEGPMWTQVQLVREIEGWVINKLAETHFV